MPATTTAAMTSAAPASTSATSRTPSSTATISAAISTVRTISSGSANVRRAFAIEVRLIRLIRKIAAALNYQCACRSRFALARCRTRSRFPSAHLRALLFQNRLARQPDTVAFHGQHLHQYLIAFFQLVAYIGNAMFRHFADVQQSLGTGNNFDKRSEVRQPRDFPEIRLADFCRRRDVADNLQRLRRRCLITRRDLDQRSEE